MSAAGTIMWLAADGNGGAVFLAMSK